MQKCGQSTATDSAHGGRRIKFDRRIGPLLATHPKVGRLAHWQPYLAGSRLVPTGLKVKMKIEIQSSPGSGPKALLLKEHESPDPPSGPPGRGGVKNKLKNRPLIQLGLSVGPTQPARNVQKSSGAPGEPGARPGTIYRFGRPYG